MKNILNKLRTDQKGQAFVIVLVLLTLGSLTIAPLLSYMSTGLKAVQMHETKMQEYYAADAGVEEGIWQLTFGGLAVPPSGVSTLPQFTLNNTTVNVTVDDISNPTYKITSTASGTTIVAYVVVRDITDGDLIVPSGAEWEGDIAATGDIVLQDSARVRGNICAGGDVRLDGRAKVELADCLCTEGDLYVNGPDAGTGGGETEVRINAYVKGDVYVGENTRVESDIYTDGVIHDPWNNILGTVYPYQPCPCAGCGRSAFIQNWEIS
jgi:cytoskeletal protein CcmA (bactofilin family)